MSYSIQIKRSAARELARIPQLDRKRIVRIIDSLEEHLLAGSMLKADLCGLYRMRGSDYRVMYEVLEDALVVLVVRIAHRREVYL